MQKERMKMKFRCEQTREGEYENCTLISQRRVSLKDTLIQIAFAIVISMLIMRDNNRSPSPSPASHQSPSSLTESN